jgi:type VI secretion system secreted protein Hcp
MPIYVNFKSSGGKSFLKTWNSRVYGLSQGDKTFTPSNIDAIKQFKFEVQSPYDASTGHASGKRQHEPIRITKETDSSSPSLFRMACTQEAFETLNINFEQVDSKGLKQPYLAMNLTKVAIVGFKRKPHHGKLSSKDVLELEEISFAFQKIDVVRKNGKSLIDDDWAAVV